MHFLFCFFLLFVFKHFIIVNKFGYNEKKLYFCARNFNL